MIAFIIGVLFILYLVVTDICVNNNIPPKN